MALPPTIPTSFVPHPSGSTSARADRGSYFDFSGAVVFVCLALFGLAIVGSIATYLYDAYLTRAQTAKDQQVAAAQAQIDQGTIASLITLQGQLTQGKRLLDQHVALSQLLTRIGALTPQTVRYGSLSVLVNADDTATVSLSGIATTFNALAALSANLATEPAIKDAIFSGIGVGKSGVQFTLSAMVDSALVQIPAAGFSGTASTPAATSTTP